MIQKTHVSQSCTELSLEECTKDIAKNWLWTADFKCCVRGESCKEKGSCMVSWTVSPKTSIQWPQSFSEKRCVQSSTDGLRRGSGESIAEIIGCHELRGGSGESIAEIIGCHTLRGGSGESIAEIIGCHKEGSGESKTEIAGCNSRKVGESNTGIGAVVGGVLGAANANAMPQTHFIGTETRTNVLLEQKKLTRKKTLHASKHNHMCASSLTPSLNLLHGACICRNI